MLNKELICKKMSELTIQLKIPKRNMVLSAGAALVLLDIRESTLDLDISVNLRIFVALRGKYPEFPIGGGSTLLRIDDVSDFHIHNPNTSVFVKDGLTVYHPKELIAQKKYLLTLPNRSEEKLAQDRKDLEGLVNYLKKGR